MKHLLLTILLTLSSCSKHEGNDSDQSTKSIGQKAKTYEAYIDNLENGPYALTTDCDSLTFVGLYAAATGKPDLYTHYYDSRWNRHFNPCYPDKSRSGISLEGILSAINFLISENDQDGLADIYQYGKSNDWVFGEGPREYTYLPQIKYLLKPYFETNLSDDPIELPDFTGYRGNVIALWVTTKGRLYGYIRKVELDLLKQLRAAERSNPIYHALIAKYESGDQGTAISILENENHFPPDRLPEQSLELFAWSDGPAAILYIWTVFIIGN